MNIIKSLILGMIVLFITSCSSFRYRIIKNSVKTDRVAKSILNTNGNVFIISSPTSSVSTIWSYCDNKLTIYNLRNGIVEVEEINLKETHFTDTISSSELDELVQCAELDGEIFSYLKKNGNNIDRIDYPIDCECLFQHDFKSNVLKMLFADIEEHVQSVFSLNVN